MGNALTDSAAMIPPAIYYSRVGLELAKLVAQSRQMALPYVSKLSKLLS